MAFDRGQLLPVLLELRPELAAVAAVGIEIDQRFAPVPRASIASPAPDQSEQLCSDNRAPWIDASKSIAE
jgi:hypothetical protein